MADAIPAFFENEIGPDAPPVFTAIEDELRHRLHIAACALLLELAHADDEFTDGERRHIHDVIRRSFGLQQDAATALLLLTERERARGAHLHEFTDLIASRLDVSQKARLVDLMWQLARSDGELLQHEAFLMIHVAQRLGLAAADMPAPPRPLAPEATP